MKLKIGLALGVGIGREVNETIRLSSGNSDWTGAAFVTVFSFLVPLFIPIFLAGDA